VNVIDIEFLFRSKIDNMLTTASRVEELKSVLGIEGVSQVWTERPEWYFWLAGASAVYHLSLESAERENGDHGAADFGLFSVRCYPYPTDPLFRRLSAEEQALINSDCFDGTNTPEFEMLSRIPRTLFHAATIELAVAEDDNWALFTLESLDVIRSRSLVDASAQADKPNEIVSLADGRIERDLPGWDLAYPLFDRLVSLYAYHSKRKPVRAALTKAPGFETVCEADRTAKIVESPESTIFTLRLLFDSNGRHDAVAGERAFTAELERDAQETEFDWEFPHGCIHHSGRPVSETAS
jgi:hypothetical protein